MPSVDELLSVVEADADKRSTYDRRKLCTDWR